MAAREDGVSEDSESGNVRIQYGALPYRWTSAGQVEVLLITSRRTRRWIIPKGWPMKGRKPWETAEIESLEEAGVSGTMGKRAIGSFRYDKLMDEDARILLCEVRIFPLLVRKSLKTWRERSQREARWLTPAQAAMLAADAGLRTIINAFVPPPPRR